MHVNCTAKHGIASAYTIHEIWRPTHARRPCKMWPCVRNVSEIVSQKFINGKRSRCQCYDLLRVFWHRSFAKYASINSHGTLWHPNPGFMSINDSFALQNHFIIIFVVVAVHTVPSLDKLLLFPLNNYSRIYIVKRERDIPLPASGSKLCIFIFVFVKLRALYIRLLHSSFSSRPFCY